MQMKASGLTICFDYFCGKLDAEEQGSDQMNVKSHARPSEGACLGTSLHLELE